MLENKIFLAHVILLSCNAPLLLTALVHLPGLMIQSRFSQKLIQSFQSSSVTNRRNAFMKGHEGSKALFGKFHKNSHQQLSISRFTQPISDHHHRKTGIITLHSAFSMYGENSAGGIYIGSMAMKLRAMAITAISAPHRTNPGTFIPQVLSPLDVNALILYCYVERLFYLTRLFT
jgi:hypothetical protein